MMNRAESEDSARTASGDSDDELSLAEWTAFLSAYADGTWPVGEVPPRPALPPGMTKRLASPLIGQYGADNPEQPLYASTTITPAVARKIRDFYSRHSYLPPPRSPMEGLREVCIEEYDLYGPKQLGNVQAATEVIAAFFPGTLCTFSLFHNRIQTHFALAGDPMLIKQYQLTTGLRIPAEDSLCGHAVLLDTSIMFVPDLDDDWRYVSNPFVRAGFKSFIGSPVTLELDPTGLASDSERSGRVAIGTLNICFIKSHLRSLTPAQEMVIRHVSSMLETQLRATWEGHHRTLEARRRRTVSEFIEKALFEGFKPTGGPASPRVDHDAGEGSTFDRTAQLAVDMSRAVLPGLEMMQVVDLVGVTATTHSALSQTVNQESPSPGRIMASYSAQASECPPLTIASTALLAMIDHHDAELVFDDDAASGLEPYLPPGTRSHVAVLFYALDQPLFMIVAASKCALQRFQAPTLAMLRSMGVILRARAIQARVAEADAEKTAFLSSISHELRTPMHSLMTGLELAEAALDDRDWQDCREIMRAVQSSGSTLRGILNDVLDFDKFDKATSGNAHPLEQVDLVEKAGAAALVCWAQNDSTRTGASITLEYEERDWRASIDKAGYDRILHNGLTNALKFCKDGPIVLSLTTSENGGVVITITDAGIGFDQARLPHLFKPFTKQNEHSPGAGLGLFITKALAKRMGGTLELASAPGVGTTFKAVVLAQFTAPSARPSGPLIRRIVTEDQSSLPPSPAPSPPPAAVWPDLVHALAAPGTEPPPPLRVLVVDDNDLCRKLLLMGLRRSPYQPLVLSEAADGAAAVAAFAAAQPDLVFTDVSMPVMDGITAAARMRAHGAARGWAPARIYAMTGLGSSDPRMRAGALDGNAELDGWLVKGKDDLKAIMRIVAQLRETQRGASPAVAHG